VPGAEDAELERQKRQKSETASGDQAEAHALASKLVVRVGTEQSQASESVEPADVR